MSWFSSCCHPTILAATCMLHVFSNVFLLAGGLEQSLQERVWGSFFQILWLLISVSSYEGCHGLPLCQLCTQDRIQRNAAYNLDSRAWYNHWLMWFCGIGGPFVCLIHMNLQIPSGQNSQHGIWDSKPLPVAGSKGEQLRYSQAQFGMGINTTI